MTKETNGVPFTSVEDAWFWFVQANIAKNDGAKIIKGKGSEPRPCEPVDIMKVLERLYRSRRLIMDHVRVLHFYGVRKMPPDPYRRNEMRAHKIWSEALEYLGEALIQKGIVSKETKWVPYNVECN